MRPTASRCISMSVRSGTQTTASTSQTAITVLASCHTPTGWTTTRHPQRIMYLVGNGVGANIAALARGGELIKEVACDPDATARISVFSPTIPELWAGRPVSSRCGTRRSATTVRNSTLISRTRTIQALIGQTAERRVRFDRERRPYFHYGLNAHTRGTPSSPVSLFGRRAACRLSAKQYDVRAGRIPSFMFRPVRAVSQICLAATCY